MPGFRITNIHSDVPLNNFDNTRCKTDVIEFEDWKINRNTLNKFLDDKVFFEFNDHIVVLEGVIYNACHIRETLGKQSFLDAVEILVRQPTKQFIQSLDGACSGAIIYKKEKRVVVFTSVLGEKSIFFTKYQGKFIIGSQLNYITDIMCHKNIVRIPNETAISQFLAYGFYLDDSTCIEGVKRLYPGTYLEIKNGNLTVQEYNKIEYSQIYDYPEKRLIQMLQTAFLNAMKKIVNKNAEYGYCNLINISGGADSRMIACAAKKINCPNVLLNCYGESGCDDARISEQIAHILGYPYIFRSTDNADCMMHIDENIQMNNGATIYYGITGGKAMLEMLNQESFGLEITGLLGDIFDGSMVVTYSEGKIDENYTRFRCSKVMEYGKDFIFPKSENGRFKKNENELYWFHARGMLFGMTSYFIRQNFVEVATPFGDSDFLKIYLSIPWNIRVKQKLLRKWFVQEYPFAASLKYANTGTSLKSTLNWWGWYLEKWQVLKRKLTISFLNRPLGMNDIRYWYNSNKQFSEYISSYYLDTINVLEGDIKEKIERLYKSPIISDRLLAVTVLAIYKNYVK